MPRLTAQDRETVGQELAAKYAAGDSIRNLATETGYSYGLCRTLLLESGTLLRPRSKQTLIG